jgi:hypothetical protein
MTLNTSDEFRVERGRRLVEQHQLRLERQRARDADALLLTAGKLIRVLVLLLRQPDLVEQLDGLWDDLLLGPLLHDHRSLDDVLQHRLVREQVMPLEHETAS